MSDDIRLATSFKSHRKRKKLRRALGDRSDSYLIDLWLTVRMDRPSGVLTGWDNIDVADAADFDGDPDLFVAALLDCGWMDQDEETGFLLIHDWDTHQAWACGAEERSKSASMAAKARWDKKIKKNVIPCGENADSMRSACGAHSSEHTNCNAPSPLPYPLPYPLPSPLPSPLPNPKPSEEEKNLTAPIIFGNLNLTSEEIKEIQRIRKKNKGGEITQRLASSLGTQFGLAINAGMSLDECLTEWEDRSWKTFKWEWTDIFKKTDAVNKKANVDGEGRKIL